MVCIGFEMALCGTLLDRPYEASCDRTLLPQSRCLATGTMHIAARVLAAWRVWPAIVPSCRGRRNRWTSSADCDATISIAHHSIDVSRERSSWRRFVRERPLCSIRWRHKWDRYLPAATLNGSYAPIGWASNEFHIYGVHLWS